MGSADPDTDFSVGCGRHAAHDVCHWIAGERLQQIMDGSRQISGGFLLATMFLVFAPILFLAG